MENGWHFPQDPLKLLSNHLKQFKQQDEVYQEKTVRKTENFQRHLI